MPDTLMLNRWWSVRQRNKSIWWVQQLRIIDGKRESRMAMP
jgi:hypothetical protein